MINYLFTLLIAYYKFHIIVLKINNYLFKTKNLKIQKDKYKLCNY